MLAAVEGPAKEWAALVNRASRGAEIDAGAVLFGGEKIDRISGSRVGKHLKLVRVHVIALLRVQKKALIAFAAFGAGVAGDLGRLIGVRQFQS